MKSFLFLHAVELLLYFIKFFFSFLFVFLYLLVLSIFPLFSFFLFLLFSLLVSSLGLLLVSAVHQLTELLIIQFIISRDIKLLEGRLYLLGKASKSMKEGRNGIFTFQRRRKIKIFFPSF